MLMKPKKSFNQRLQHVVKKPLCCTEWWHWEDCTIYNTMITPHAGWGWWCMADWCSCTGCNHCRTMRKKCSSRTASTIGFVRTRWSILCTVWAIWYVCTWQNWRTAITLWNFKMWIGSRERSTRCHGEGMHLWYHTRWMNLPCRTEWVERHTIQSNNCREVRTITPQLCRTVLRWCMWQGEGGRTLVIPSWQFDVCTVVIPSWRFDVCTMIPSRQFDVRTVVISSWQFDVMSSWSLLAFVSPSVRTPSYGLSLIPFVQPRILPMYCLSVWLFWLSPLYGFVVRNSSNPKSLLLVWVVFRRAYKSFWGKWCASKFRMDFLYGWCPFNLYNLLSYNPPIAYKWRASLFLQLFFSFSYGPTPYNSFEPVGLCTSSNSPICSMLQSGWKTS